MDGLDGYEKNPFVVNPGGNYGRGLMGLVGAMEPFQKKETEENQSEGNTLARKGIGMAGRIGQGVEQPPDFWKVLARIIMEGD